MNIVRFAHGRGPAVFCPEANGEARIDTLVNAKTPGLATQSFMTTDQGTLRLPWQRFRVDLNSGSNLRSMPAPSAQRNR